MINDYSIGEWRLAIDVIMGWIDDACAAAGNGSSIGGGVSNRASGPVATVPGGQYNRAAGHASFAAGFGARAEHDGSFVWSDLSTPYYPTTGMNQFIIQSGGGVGIQTNNPTSPLTVAGTIESTTGGVKFPDGTTQTTAAFGPIAAAVISPLNGCTVGSSTGNVICESFENGTAVLTIVGETYDVSFITTATIGSSGLIPPLTVPTPHVRAFQGKMYVGLIMPDGTRVNRQFSFVTYKP